MPNMARYTVFTAFLTLGLSGACGKCGQKDAAYYRVDAIDLRLPVLDGWQQDAQAQLKDPAAAGTVLRLKRKSAIAGSPRITVDIEAKKAVATRLNPFVEQNLRQMAAMEHNGQLTLNRAEKRETLVGPRRAYRLHHEFTMGTGSASIALTQVSLILVVDGRGVTITASGRTELYYPLAPSIERLFDGVRVGTDPKGTTGAQEPVEPNAENGEFIDLGTIGGKDSPE